MSESDMSFVRSGTRSVSGGARTIGIDVGASKIIAAVVDAEGNVLHRVHRQRTPDSSSMSLVALLARVIDTLRSAVPGVQGIGVGIAGIVTWPEGEVEFAANHGHWPLELRRRLAEEYELAVVVENDANAAAWAEAATDPSRDGPLLFLAAGTGLGSGIVVDGHLIRDSDGQSFEIGHVVLPDSPRRCVCGKVGCLEALASGRALARAAERLARKPGSSLAGRVGYAEDKVSAMIDAALDGDPDVVRVVQAMGRLIGRTIAESTMRVLPIKRVVVGGGLAVLGERLLGPMRQACREALARSDGLCAPRIDEAVCGPDAVLIGAALLAHREAQRRAGSPRAVEHVPVDRDMIDTSRPPMAASPRLVVAEAGQSRHPKGASCPP